MNAPDTSVLVAALVSWHERHEVATAALEDCVLIGHTSLELLSVLTRLPEPHRVEGAIIADFLEAQFAAPPLTLPLDELRELPRLLSEHGVTGGAVHDGLIAATARHHGAHLVSLDERAQRTYERLGVEHTLL